MGKGVGFTEADRKKLGTVLSTVNTVSKEFASVKNLLKKAVEVIDSQAKHICSLYSEINRCNYRNDALNQYGRKECLQALGLKPEVHGTDPEKIMLEIAQEIEDKAEDKNGDKVNIDMSTNDIQRCNFIGDKKKKLVCKFMSYRLRMKILLNKRVINGAKLEIISSFQYKLEIRFHIRTSYTNVFTAHLVHEEKMYYKIYKSALPGWSD